MELKRGKLLDGISLTTLSSLIRFVTLFLPFRHRLEKIPN